ncbi:vomeronasal type-2 receptor 26-like [Pelodytes ibericus]
MESQGLKICIELFDHVFYVILIDHGQYRSLLAFIFAIDEINKDLNILPNVTLGYHVYDSCGDAMKAIQGVLKILSGNDWEVPNYSCQKRGKVAGIIGDHQSTTTLPMAQILTMYRYTQISYGATNPLLSDRKQFPYFFRTVQDDQIHFRGISKVLKLFGWNWVGILVSQDESGERELRDLKQEISSHGICIEFILEVHMEAFIDNVNPSNRPDDPLLEDIWLKYFSCPSTNYVKYRFFSSIFKMSPCNCTGKERITDRRNNPEIGPEKYEYKNQLHNYVRKIHFTDQAGKDIFFNERGEVPSKYYLVNWGVMNEGNAIEFVKRTIGTLFTSHTGDLKLKISKKEIIWKNGKIPQARCNEYCLPGSRKAPGRRHHICCYDCVQCSEGTISNMIDSENCEKCSVTEWPDKAKIKCIPKMFDFLSYDKDVMALGFSFASVFFWVLTILVLRVFILFRNSPIVRANNRKISFVLLVSIMLSFPCVFLFLGRPVDITCMLRQTSFGIIFSVAVSSILAKTIMVCIAFKATKPGSSWKKWMGVNVSYSIVLMCSSVQVLINVIWLSTSPPFQEFDMHSYPGTIIIQCNEGSVIAFYTVLGYMGFLAAVSFIIAYLARTLPDSFNEAKYITFSMLVFCSVWIAMIPAYLSTKGKDMVAVEIFAILASNAGILSCMFFSKCYILLVKPENNMRRHLLQKK